MATCVYCGRGSQTKEDALPRWVWTALGVRGSAEIRRASDGGLVRTTSKPDLRVGAPCADCNSGWMSDLETRFKSAGGEQLLTGAVPVTLEPSEAETVALWIVKTAQMVHDALAYQAGDVQIPASHYSSLAAGRPHEGTVVYVGGVDAGGHDILFLRPIGLNRGVEPIAYVMALSVGYLLAVVAAPTAPGVSWTSPMPSSLAQNFDVVWPVPTQAVTWPRTRTLTVDEFDNRWSATRWGAGSSS